MNNAYSINPRRLMLLVKNSLIINRNPILVLAAVFSALIILNAVRDIFTGTSPDLYRNVYYFLLYISGFAVTWGIAKELNDKRKVSTWLLLPASTMEKFLSLLLLPTVLLICGAALYMTVVSISVEAGISIFASSSHRVFNPFDSDLYKGIMVYLTIQAPFFLGAIYFKKNAIGYSFLSLFAYGVILAVITAFTGKLLFGEHFAQMAEASRSLGNTDKLYLMSMIDKYMQFGQTWKPIVIFFIRFVVPPVCWITAFFKLKEREQ